MSFHRDFMLYARYISGCDVRLIMEEFDVSYKEMAKSVKRWAIRISQFGPGLGESS